MSSLLMANCEGNSLLKMPCKIIKASLTIVLSKQYSTRQYLETNTTLGFTLCLNTPSNDVVFHTALVAVF